MTNAVEVGESQWIGRRQRQEDTTRTRLLALQDTATGAAPDGAQHRVAEAAIAVLADGMGGHAGGARASALAAELFLRKLADCESHETIGGDVLADAVNGANQAIAEEAERSPDLKGMGCTLIGCIVGGSRLRWISIGDSLLLRFRREDGSLERLNEDHSLAPLLQKAVELGELTPQEAATHPQRNALRSALIGGEISLIDRNDDGVALAPGDLVVLASDGLITLSEEQIRSVLASNKDATASEIATALTAAVEAVGAPHQDNTSVVVVAYRDAAQITAAKTVSVAGNANASVSAAQKNAGRPSSADMPSVAALVAIGAVLTFAVLYGGTFLSGGDSARKPEAASNAETAPARADPVALPVVKDEPADVTKSADGAADGSGGGDKAADAVKPDAGAPKDGQQDRRTTAPAPSSLAEGKTAPAEKTEAADAGADSSSATATAEDESSPASKPGTKASEAARPDVDKTAPASEPIPLAEPERSAAKISEDHDGESNEKSEGAPATSEKKSGLPNGPVVNEEEAPSPDATEAPVTEPKTPPEIMLTQPTAEDDTAPDETGAAPPTGQAGKMPE